MVHLVSFADSRLTQAKRRFRRQALQVGWFRSITILNEKNLDADFRTRHREILKPGVRGFGYWIWKPQVLLQRLREMEDGHLCVYADIGFHLNPQGGDRFLELVNRLENSDCDLLVFAAVEPLGREFWDNRSLPSYVDSFWTKGDLLDRLGMRNHPEVHTPTLTAGLLFVRNTAALRGFLVAWAQLMEDHHLIDDTVSESPNLEGFRGHRHDQSCFSLLLKGGALQYLSESAFEYWLPRVDNLGEPDWPPLQSEPFLAKRDKKNRRGPFRKRLRALRRILKLI